MRNRISLLIVPLLLLVTNAFGAVTWSQYSYFQNSGGLNNAFSPIAIDDSDASDLQNVIFTVSGSIKKRSGFALVNNTTSPTCGITYYKKAAGTQYLVRISVNDTIEKMDYGANGPDGVWDAITGSLSFNVGANNLSSFAIGEDTLIIEDGLASTVPYIWNGTGNCAAIGGSPPKATVVAYHKNMAFAAGNEDAPSTLYFSDVGNINAWASGLAGNVAIETNDGSIIRTIVPGFDALYIFKDYSIFRLTGTDKDSFQIQKMVSNIGVTSPQAVSLINNQFFLTTGQGDVYLYDGAIGIKKISSKIGGTLKTDLSYSRYGFVSSVVYDSDYYLSVGSSGSSTNDMVLMFDTFTLSWTKFKGMNINAMAVADDGTGRKKMFFGDYNGTTEKYPQGDDDNGQPIVSYYTTKQFYYPELGPAKDLKLLKVYVAEEATNYSIGATILKDFETSGTAYTVYLNAGVGSTFGTAVYGVDVYGGETIITNRIEANTEGSFYKFNFTNSNANQSFEIFGYQTYIQKVDRI